MKQMTVQTRKAVFRKSVIASAVAAAMASPLGWADDYHGGFKSKTSLTVSKEKTVEKAVGIKKSTETTKQTGYAGDVSVSGEFEVKALGLALIDNEQFSVGNEVDNQRNSNDAAAGEDDSSDGGAFQGASGNLGANIAAGTGNQQDNAAALATSDASWVFGGESADGDDDSVKQQGIHSDASVLVDQESSANQTANTGAQNASGFSGNSFDGATGNIGANAAAGNGNQQKNNLAIASMTGRAVLTEASVSTLQSSHGNVTSNLPACDCTPSTNTASIAGNAFRGASGNVGVNVASGTGNQQSNSLAISGSDI